MSSTPLIVNQEKQKAGEEEYFFSTDDISIDKGRYPINDNRRGEDKQGVVKKMMISNNDSDTGTGQYNEGDDINDEGAPSSEKILNDMIERYDKGVRVSMMMESPVMIRGNQHILKNHEDAYRLKICHFLLLNMTITEVRETIIMGKSGIYGLFPCQGSSFKTIFVLQGVKIAKNVMFEATYS